MQRLLLTIVLAALSVVVRREAAAQSASGPLQVSDAMGLRSFIGVRGIAAISPDDSLVAYTLCDPRRVDAERKKRKGATVRFWVGCYVAVIPLAGGQPETIPHEGGSRSPIWSPDGRLLAFYGEDIDGLHLWVWDRTTRKAKRVTERVVDAFTDREAPLWLSDSRRIVSKFSLRSTSTEAKRNGDAEAWAVAAMDSSTVKVQQATGSAGRDETNWARYPLIDFAIANVSTGKVEPIRSSTPAAGYWISRDGRWLWYTRNPAKIADGVRSFRWTLEAVDLSSLKSYIRARADQYHGHSVRISADGEAAAFFSGLAEDSAASLMVVTLRDSARKLAGAENFGTTTRDAPIWGPTGKDVYAIRGSTLWRGDTAAKSLTAVGIWKDREILHIIPSDVSRDDVAWSTDGGATINISARYVFTGRVEMMRVTILAGGARAFGDSSRSIAMPGDPPAVTADGRSVVYLGEAADSPPELYVANAEFYSRRKLTSINPEIASKKFGRSRVISFRAADGKELNASLLLPVDYVEGRRYPTVAWIYGGSQGSRNANQFGLVNDDVFNMQLLATRGYAVLFPDIPLTKGAYIKSLMDALMPAIDRAIELGFVDGDRLALMGQSAGGYGTLGVVTQTTRFKAAVMCAGFGELSSFWGHGWVEWLEGGAGGMEVPPWVDPQRYVQNSPLYFLDRIQTPMLIEAGADDPGIGPFSRHVFTGLQRLKKPATYLEYGGEGHVLASYPNLVDFWTRVTSFLGYYLRDGAS
jgi:dipeptidyl aminopeptidase/acylaminoacyl peptidase